MSKNNIDELATFFDLSLNLLCIAGVDAKFKRVNPQFMNLLGYSEEELLRTPFIDLVHPDDREKTIEAVSQLSKGIDVVNFENRYICKNGSFLNIRWAAAPDADKGKIYAVGADITIQKHQEYFKNKLNEIRDMYISGKRRKNQFWDRTLELILEVSESEYGFIGEIRHGKNGDPYLKTFSLTNISWNEQTRKLFNEKSKEGLEFHNLDTLFGEVIKTGEVLISNDPKNHPKAAGIPVGHPSLNSFLGVPLHLAGKFIGMVGLANRNGGYDQGVYDNLREIFQTISSIVHSFLLERDLNETAKLNSLYKNAIDKSSLVSITDPNGKITYVNDQFVKITGFSREELIGKNHRIINSGKMPKYFFENLWMTIKSGKSWQGEICNKSKNGEEFWVESNIVPFTNEMGEIDRFISIKKDITQERMQKKLELDYQKAKEATKAKSEFLSTMSHEIRTPLNGVLSMTELLRDLDLTREQLKIVNTISNSGKTLLTIVNDILDLSKIEAGKMTFESHEVFLSEFIEEILEPIKYTCLDKNVLFKFHKNDFNFKVLIDEGRIGQVVTNLVSNAVKFTKKGEITVSMQQKEISNGFVEIKIDVKDTGIGISSSFLKEIFDPFSQSSAVSDNHIHGTGLGLSISKKIIDAFDGTIKVESKTGVGSTFSINLCVPKGRAYLPKIDDVFGDNGKMNIKNIKEKNILIVEDNPTNQFVISCLVSKLGHHYKITGNGSEALIELEENEYDLILMDCQMPLINGYEASRMIRQSRKKFQDIPIVALTANVIKGDDKKCYEYGMNGYLTKPIMVDDLEKELNKFFLEENNIVDCRAIERLLNEDFSGDLNLLEQTIETFLKTTKPRIDELLNEIENEKPVSIKFISHSLVPSLKLLGAKKLGYIIDQLNINPVVKNKSEIIKKIKGEYKLLEGELNNYLENNVSSHRAIS